MTDTPRAKLTVSNRPAAPGQSPRSRAPAIQPKNTRHAAADAALKAALADMDSAP